MIVCPLSSQVVGKDSHGKLLLDIDKCRAALERTRKIKELETMARSTDIQGCV